MKINQMVQQTRNNYIYNALQTITILSIKLVFVFSLHIIALIAL